MKFHSIDSTHSYCHRLTKERQEKRTRLGKVKYTGKNAVAPLIIQLHISGHETLSIALLLHNALGLGVVAYSALTPLVFSTPFCNGALLFPSEERQTNMITAII